MRIPAEPTSHAEVQRLRLMDALSALLASKGFHLISISDIVAQARVSKRTFYEQFDTKESCLLALCQGTAERLLNALAASYDPRLSWDDQLTRVTRGYLERLQTEPALIRALFLDLLSLGPRGLAARRQIMRRFANFLVLQVEFAHQREPDSRALSDDMAEAVVGGINELILRSLEQDQVHNLTRLTEPACELVRAVVSYLRPAPVEPGPAF